MREYFADLMNGINEKEKRLDEVEVVNRVVQGINRVKVRTAMRRMKSGKAVPVDIPVDAWKFLGEMAVEFTRLFTKVKKVRGCPMSME